MHDVQQYRTGLPGIEAVSLSSSRHFPRHSHDQFGIGVIISGAHRSWSGMGWVEAGVGDAIMVNPGEMHDGQPIDGIPRSWKMLYFDPQLVEEELSEDVPVMSLSLQPRAQDRQQAALFGYLFRSLIEPQPDLLSQEESLLTLLIYAFRHHSIQRKPTFEAATPEVAKVIRLIDSFPERVFTLAEMAIVAGHSRFQLLRGFRRATGVTPHAYILQRRVRLARRLLAAGKAPAEASIDAGFADQSHMTRAFTRQFGVTPARYRAVVYGPKHTAISFKT